MIIKIEICTKMIIIPNSGDQMVQLKLWEAQALFRGSTFIKVDNVSWKQLSMIHLNHCQLLKMAVTTLMDKFIKE
jgi:hypothetical protein